MAERRPLVVTSDAPASAPASAEVADLLLEAYLDPRAAEMQHIGSYELPSDAQIDRVVEMCRALLFPGYASSKESLLAREATESLLAREAG